MLTWNTIFFSVSVCIGHILRIRAIYIRLQVSKTVYGVRCVGPYGIFAHVFDILQENLCGKDQNTVEK